MPTSELTLDRHRGPCAVHQSRPDGHCRRPDRILPISSTGHLILAGSLLDFSSNIGADKAKVFDIAIQTGAIFAVILVYMQRIRDTLSGLSSEPKSQRFAMNVIVGFLPAVVMWAAVRQGHQGASVHPGGGGHHFILGGFIIIWAERMASRVQLSRPNCGRHDCTRRTESGPGAVPGPGARHQPFGRYHHWRHDVGLSRQAATEFSFSGHSHPDRRRRLQPWHKERALLSMADLPVQRGPGAVSSCRPGCVCWLIRYAVSNHNFLPFAW